MILKSIQVRRFLHPDRRRRGMTLLEVLFASTIGTVVSVAMILLFTALLWKERENLKLLMMSNDAATLHRRLRQVSANGADIDVTQTEVVFTDVTTGKTARLRFVDGDNNPETIGNNRIELDLDIASAGNERIVVNYVSRLEDPRNPGTFLPVFRRLPASSFSTPLEVNFRIGDRTNPTNRKTNAAARADDAHTGPGFQSLVFRSAYMPRNS